MKSQLFIGLLLLITVKSLSQNPASIINKSDTIPVYHVVDIMPAYPGGVFEMMKFLSKNIKYPVICCDLCLEGRVILKFLVEVTGELSDIRVIRTLDKYLDEEAIRVVKLMPKWIPAQMNGENVRCYYVLPVLLGYLSNFIIYEKDTLYPLMYSCLN